MSNEYRTHPKLKLSGVPTLLLHGTVSAAATCRVFSLGEELCTTCPRACMYVLVVPLVKLFCNVMLEKA